MTQICDGCGKEIPQSEYKNIEFEVIRRCKSGDWKKYWCCNPTCLKLCGEKLER